MANPLKDATLDDLEDEIRRRRNSMKKTRRKKLGDIHDEVVARILKRYLINFNEEISNEKWDYDVPRRFISDDGVFAIYFRCGLLSFYIRNRTSGVHDFLYDLAEFIPCDENSSATEVYEAVVEEVDGCDDSRQTFEALAKIYGPQKDSIFT